MRRLLPLLLVAVLAGSALGDDAPAAGRESPPPMDSSTGESSLWRPDWGLGPLEWSDQFLLAVTHLNLGPASPRTLHEHEVMIALRGDLSRTESDYFPRDIVIDGEVVQATAVIRYGLTDRVQLALEVPMVWRWEGVLDPFIRRVESIYGNVRGERRDLASNMFRVEGTTDDGAPFKLGPGVGLAKTTLGAKIRLLDGAPAWYPALSFETIFALPTGMSTFGTKGIDTGIRLAASKRAGDFVFYWGGAGMAFAGNEGPIKLEPVKGVAFLGLEFEVEPWLSLIYEGWVHSPGERNLQGHRGLVVYQGLGLKALFGHAFVEVGLAEDFGDITRAGDVNSHLEVGYTF